MSMTTIEAMNITVRNAGGRMTEDEYLEGVYELITNETGRETSIDSLKVNAFNKDRMVKAGVCRATINNVKEVWSIENAVMVLNGDGGASMNKPTETKTDDSTFVKPTAQPRVEGGVFYGIPRADPNDYPEFLQAMIPTVQGFVQSEREEFRLLALRYKQSLAGNTTKAHCLLVGPKGCGKSLVVKDFFGHLNVPLLRLNMSDGITEDAFIGARTIEEGTVYFQDGILPIGMEYGIPILADEINGARENILIAKNMAMDSGVLVIAEDNNRVVRAKAGFMIIGTMNPPEDYAGVNNMNQATRDRFTYNLPFDYLTAEKEVQIVMEQTGFSDRELVSKLVDFAGDLRRLKKSGQMETDTSTRTLVQLVGEMEHLTLKEAIDYVMLGRYDIDEQYHVQASARARFEEYI